MLKFYVFVTDYAENINLHRKDIITFLNPSFSLVTNFMLTANFAFKEDRLHGTMHQKKKKKKKTHNKLNQQENIDVNNKL